jgi:CubicO group peptidase (beta-lactamase class C family)
MNTMYSFSTRRAGGVWPVVSLALAAALTLGLMASGLPAESNQPPTAGSGATFALASGAHDKENSVLSQAPSIPSELPPAYGVFEADEVEAFLDELLAAQLSDYHIAGAAVAVVKDGQLLFAGGYGMADLEANLPVVADQTLFRTDSTGKLFVWTAVMQLVEQGRLSLTADVNTYLDFSLPATFPEPITLAHLLSHSAGFDDQGYLSAHSLADLQPTGEWLAANIPARVRPPGVVSGYSNYGAGLAGYIVEKVSGLPFEQYMEDHLFHPLGMFNSTFRQPVPPELAPAITTNYHYADGRFTALPTQYLRIPATGEGHMTVTDMARFMLAHLQPDDSALLTAATAQQMHSQLFTNDPRASGIAYGFAESTQNGLRLLRHEGNLVGVSSTALFLVPEQHLGVYVVFNSNGGFGPGDDFRRAFLDHYFPAQPVRPQAIPLTTDQVQALAGSYRSTRMFATTFGKIMRLLGGNYADIVVRANRDGTFTTDGLGAGSLQWVPAAPDVLRLADGAQNSYGDLVFGTDAHGRFQRLTVANNPYRAYEKVAWYESVRFHVAWLALAELGLILALLGWPAGWLLRGYLPDWHGPALNPVGGWLLAGACTVAVLFPLGLLLTVPEALVYGFTPALASVLLMPLAASVLASGALFLAMPVWSSLSVLARLHYAVVLAALMAFVGWCGYWNLLGWRV